MKKLALGLVALATVGGTASAITRLGDSAELFLTGTIAARTDDNIFLTDIEEIDDTIFDIAPGLKLTFGQGAQTTGSLEIAETFSRYLDNDVLNDELFSGIFHLKYDDAKLKLNTDAAYRQLNQSTRDVRGTTLVGRDVTNLAADSEISVSDKSSTGAGVTWDQTEYDDPTYVDIKEFAIPVNYFYSISEKVDLSAGVRYRKTTLAGNGPNDSADYYYNVGARGDFTAKFNGTFSIGYNQRKPEQGSNEDSVGFLSQFNYELSGKTKIALAISNDYGTSAEGDSQKTFIFTPALMTALSPQWEGMVSLSYQDYEYFNGREDKYLEGKINATYLINESAKVSIGYTYRKNDSSLTFVDTNNRQRSGDFANNIISLTGDIRF